MNRGLRHFIETEEDAFDLNRLCRILMEHGLEGEIALEQRIRDLSVFTELSGRTHWALAYTRSIEFYQLISSYRVESTAKRTENKIRTVELLESNLSSYQNFLEEIESGRAKVDMRELKANFQRLLDVPVTFALEKFYSMVSEVSARLGKKVTLKVLGDSILIERHRLFAIQESLIHLVRNSLDHGIEGPKERRAAGKQETGTIELECFKEAGDIVLAIRDDGRGIDLKGVCNKAVQMQLVKPEEIQNLNVEEKLNLIFLPNFSTKPTVTDLSGRGVGLDIARQSLSKIGGHILVKTELGLGTEFRIVLSGSRSELPSPRAVTLAG